MFACIGNQGRCCGQSHHPHDHGSAGLILAVPSDATRANAKAGLPPEAFGRPSASHEKQRSDVAAIEPALHENPVYADLCSMRT
jgi:hypothetical protein